MTKQAYVEALVTASNEAIAGGRHPDHGCFDVARAERMYDWFVGRGWSSEEIERDAARDIASLHGVYEQADIAAERIAKLY